MAGFTTVQVSLQEGIHDDWIELLYLPVPTPYKAEYSTEYVFSYPLVPWNVRTALWFSVSVSTLMCGDHSFSSPRTWTIH